MIYTMTNQALQNCELLNIDKLFDLWREISTQSWIDLPITRTNKEFFYVKIFKFVYVMLFINSLKNEFNN